MFRQQQLVALVQISLVVGVCSAGGVALSATRSLRMTSPSQGQSASSALLRQVSTGTGIDEGAAEAEIRRAFMDHYTGATSAEVKAAAAQDSAQLAETRERARERSLEVTRYTQEDFDTLTISIAEVRLLDSATAAVRFSLHLSRYGETLVRDFPGYAVFEDGRWKVSRRTQCEVWALGGTICPAEVVPRMTG